MQISEFTARLEAARQAGITIGAATYNLRLPTDYEWRTAIEANRDSEGRLLPTQAFRSILNAALIGWEGVSSADLMPDATPEPLPFSAAAKTALLDLRLDIVDELTVVLGLKLKERREAREAARKN